MDLGHFQYILEGAHQSKVASSDRLELLAKTAAKRYLEESVSLNETIKKIATENDLNRHQIERVCEMANIATHQVLWRKTAQKESVSFPLADAKTVVETVKPSEGEGDAGEPKPHVCGSIASDYAGPPKGLPSSGPSMLGLMGADPAAVHHGLRDEPERKQIVIILQKKAHARKAIQDWTLVRGMELESLEKRAFVAVKQAVIGGATFRQIYEAAAGCELGKVAEKYLPGFEEQLIADTHGDVRRRLIKTAIGKAPEEFVSDNLGNTTIINGAHPVMISLDTINRKTGEIRNGLHNLLRIDDEVKVYTQRLRELT